MDLGDQFPMIMIILRSFYNSGQYLHDVLYVQAL